MASQCSCGWRASPGCQKIGRIFGRTDERDFSKSYGWCLVFLIFSNSGVHVVVSFAGKTQGKGFLF